MKNRGELAKNRSSKRSLYLGSSTLIDSANTSTKPASPLRQFWRDLKHIGSGLLCIGYVLYPTTVQAQFIQRSFLNPSFEAPVFSAACFVQVVPGTIPGWETTHGGVQNGAGNCTGYVSPGTVPLIEIWTTGFNGVNTATGAGNQFAELNAEQASALYQNLCLINNEQITFSLLHRGRASASTADVASFRIGTITPQPDPGPSTFTGTEFARVSTANDGNPSGATPSSVSVTPVNNGWVRYGGTLTYASGTGISAVGFEAISTGGGNNTIGNFLDDVQFAGLPVIEFTTGTSGNAPESETNPTTNPPQIRVVGLVPTGGINVPVSIDPASTATLGVDFTTPTGTSNFNVAIPEGNYDGTAPGSIFTIPFTVIQDSGTEGSETIVFEIQPSPNFFNFSTTTCGGAPNEISTYTIFDDDFLSGTVWNDANGSAAGTFTNIQTGSETGTNAGGLNAILINNSNQVIATTPVQADGTYTFIDVPFNSNVQIRLSTTAGTVGAVPPAESLPANWVNTSPLTTASFNTGTSVTGRDFGIEQLPNTTDVSAVSQANPGGTTQVQVVTLAGTDPEDGALGASDSFRVVTLPGNGTLYYNGVAVVANQLIPNYNPALLTVDPDDGAITVTFTYAAVDAAGREDPTPATVTMPFTTGGTPLLLLVKRVTAVIVSGVRTDFNTGADLLDSPGDPNDGNAAWTANYLLGGGVNDIAGPTDRVDTFNIKPQDEIEYTIYFLNVGTANAQNIRICDRLDPNVTFVDNAYNGLTPTDGGLPTNLGVALAIGSTTPTVYLTSSNDPPDRGELVAAPAIPANCNLAGNDSGVVVVNLTSIPNSTGSGTPANSYGFVRFRVRVR